MAPGLKGGVSLLLLAFAVVMFILPAAAFAQDAGDPTTSISPAPTIQSDKADYAPGELVTLTGSNWQPGESVRIVVDDDGLQEQTWQRDVTVTADDGGNITDQFNLPEWFVANYSVKAMGSSGSEAMTTFTDAVKAASEVTPGLVAGGSTREFTLLVTNKVTGQTDLSTRLGCARITLPDQPNDYSDVDISGWTSASTTANTAVETNTWDATYNSTTRRVLLTAKNNEYRLKQDGWVKVKITAKAPSTNVLSEWTTTAREKIDCNNTSSNATFTFDKQPTVKVDSTAPRVTDIVPTAGAEDVAVGTNVRAFFSEEMRAGTIRDADEESTTFKLKEQGASQSLAASVSYDPATQKATLNPSAALDYSTTYVATVTTGAEDVAGNQLDQNPNIEGNQARTWTFTTADGIAPTSTAEATVPNDSGGTSTYDSGTWINKSVTVTLDATDNEGGSGVKELVYSATGAREIASTVVPVGDLPKQLTFNGGATTVSYFARDKAGNVEQAKSFEVKIDKTAPSIKDDGADATFSEPNAAGWYKNDVRNKFSATDGGSGLAVATQASFTETTTGEGSAVKVASGTVADVAGNVAASVASKGFQIDKTAPSVSASVSPTRAANGWYNRATGAPKVSYQCSDALSGIVPGACPADHTFGEGADQSHSSGDVSDLAGNTASASVNDIDVDLTAPSKPEVSFGRAPEDREGGYFKDAVTVAYGGSTDSGGSGLKSISANQTFETTGSHDYSGVAEDNAGNVSDAASGKVKVDASAPVVDPESLADSAWRKDPLSRDFTASDSGSGLANTTDASFTLTASAESQGVNDPTVDQRVVSDKVGHSVTRSVSALIDLTKPNISVSTTGLPADSGWYNLDTGAPVVRFECSDALSGIAAGACPADQAITTEGADQGYSASVSDRAGNSDSAGVSGLKIDLTRPDAAGAPDLLASSDSGDNDDNLTKDQTPTFDVEAEPGSTVRLYGQEEGAANPALLGSDPADINGVATIESRQTLPDGTYKFHATVTDQAGNVSSTETIRVTIVTVDATAPGAPTGLDMADASDSGSSNSDDITKEPSPVISGSAEPGSDVKLYAGADLVGSAKADATTGDWTIPTSALGEGRHELTATATDAADNTSRASTALVVIVDMTAPTNVAGTPDRAANAHGWYNRPVAVSFSGTDALSGIASCSSATYDGPDDGAASVNGSCVDKAGNSANGSFGLKYDSTAPTVTVGAPTSQPNAAGWYNSAVTNNFSASDGLSGLADDGQTAFQNSSDSREEGASVMIGSGDVYDKAGNVASENAGPFQIDMTAPRIVNDGPTTAANPAGWYRTDVTNKFSALDALSGLADTREASITRTTQGEGRAVTVASGTVADKAGNIAASVESDGFRIDQTRPVIVATGTVSGTDGTNGWYKSAISVEFRASDGLSGFSGGADPYAFTQSSGTQQGDAVAVNSGPVADLAGNAAVTVNSGPFKIDYTKPLLNPSVSPNPVSLNGSATADAGATDDHSGIAVASCASVDTSSVGTKSGVSCSATDRAGNSNTGITPSYKVVYGSGFGGVLQPINGGLTPSLTAAYDPANPGAFGDDNSRFKLGSTVPVKFRLADANGNPVTDAVARLNVKKADNNPDAGTDEAISTAASTEGNLFRYDATSGQYIFNLSTKSGYTNPNGTSITAFGQGTYTLSVLLNDGTTRSVNIQIVK